MALLFNTQTMKIGESGVFDFSADIPSGQQIASFVYGLASVKLYIGSYYPIAHMQVKLTVSGDSKTTITLMPTLVMTDNKGHNVVDQEFMETQIIVTVIALLGASTANPPTFLSNVTQIPSGSSPSEPTGAGFGQPWAMLSGFDISSDSAENLQTMNVSVGAQPGQGNAIQLSANGDYTGSGGSASVGTLDIGLIAPGQQVDDIAIALQASSQPSNAQTYDNTFRFPSNYEIEAAAVLLQSFNITYPKDVGKNYNLWVGVNYINFASGNEVAYNASVLMTTETSYKTPPTTANMTALIVAQLKTP